MADTKIQMELNPAEREAVERMRMTAEERLADMEARCREAMEALPKDMQELKNPIGSNLKGKTPQQRRAHIGALRLGTAIAALKRDSEAGLPIADALAQLQQSRGDELAWMNDQLIREAK